MFYATREACGKALRSGQLTFFQAQSDEVRQKLEDISQIFREHVCNKHNSLWLTVFNRGFHGTSGLTARGPTETGRNRDHSPMRL